jgi:phage-related protein
MSTALARRNNRREQRQQRRQDRRDRMISNRQRDWNVISGAISTVYGDVTSLFSGGRDLILATEDRVANTARNITDTTGDVVVRGVEIAGGSINSVAAIAGGAITDVSREASTAISNTAESLSMPLIIGGLIAAYVLTQTDLIKIK